MDVSFFITHKNIRFIICILKLIKTDNAFKGEYVIQCKVVQLGISFPNQPFVENFLTQITLSCISGIVKVLGYGRFKWHANLCSNFILCFWDNLAALTRS